MGDLQYDRCSAELSVFAMPGFRNNNFKSLEYFCKSTEIKATGLPSTPETKFLNDVVAKILMRGEMTFPAYCVEEQIVSLYGSELGLRLRDLGPGKKRQSFEYDTSPALETAYNDFRCFGDAHLFDPAKISFDPQHPDNERRLYTRLIEKFGPNINPYLYTQAAIDKILTNSASQFAGQRADFVFAFPDGKVFVLEPGDHQLNPAQKTLDDMRDNAFQKDLKASTHRPTNQQIDDPLLMDQIKKQLEDIDAFKWMSSRKGDRHADHLFLLPTLIARIEKSLTELLLFRGHIQKERISIAVIENDLCCAELAILGFLDRLKRLSNLYGLDLRLPAIQLTVYRNKVYDICNLSGLREKLSQSYGCSTADYSEPVHAQYDIVLDVAIKSTPLLPTRADVFSFGYAVTIRNCFVHNETVPFSYLTQPKPILDSDRTEDLLTGFLQDFFRKCELRPGQLPILTNVLSQKPTIGLLPTSGGKSICYQLAALLTPGTTLVIDPIKMLMDDQAQGLQESYRINRAHALHSGAGPVTTEKVARILQENLIVFLSPERFLRKNFREALAGAQVAGIYINYAVIDEAHCVSMWGHDFRPPYLVLERNIKKTCSRGTHSPLTVALTGTASQLVLIDLKRELNIESMESIVRPDTFDRPELNFRIKNCTEDQKRTALDKVLNTPNGILQVTELGREAWGMIFSYTPNELCPLLGTQIAKATTPQQAVLHTANHINAVLQCNGWTALRAISLGLAVGSKPGALTVSEDDWEKYKERILFAFKRGAIRRLFGNAAAGVGIDNDKVNYVINYRMPQSIESYYQMCGRAGRAGQTSDCCLLFTDDNPVGTKAWLDKGTPRPDDWANRDDISTIIYFHGINFPDPQVLKQETQQVFRNIMTQLGNGAPSIQQTKIHPDDNFDRTERYIGFLLMMGVIDDYTVSGSGAGTIYNLTVNQIIRDYAADRENHREAYRNHLVDHLHKYLLRYRPMSRAQLSEKLNESYPPPGKPSERILGFLIDFIHIEIGKQRKEAVRTMLRFCTQPNTSPEQLRTTIKAYFDRNPKFSDKLDAMANSPPDVTRILEVISTVEDFNDAEHLYWETRRLLDERFRGDWALANMYSILYRERGISDEVLRLLSDTMRWLSDENTFITEDAVSFLAAYYSFLPKLDTIWGEELCMPILDSFMQYHYKESGTTYLPIIDRLELVPGMNAGLLTISITSTQIKELIDVTRRP